MDSLPHASRRDGLSRVEALILLVIVVLLTASALPALQSVREIARRHQCVANLRNLGVALHAYHDTYACLPPACFWNDAEMIIDPDRRPMRSPDTVKSSRANWVQLLLPYFGCDDLWRQFAHERTVTDAVNQTARTAPLSVMTCPSDNFNSTANLYVLTTSNKDTFYFARGNYAINGGTQTQAEYPGQLMFPIADGNVIEYRSSHSDFMWWGNGVAGFNKCFSFKDFTNAQGTTVALDEIRAGIVPEDPRGAWALGQIASSVTWCHGVTGDDGGPNNQWRDSDDLLDGHAIVAKYGMQPFTEERMPFCAHCTFSNEATARSLHPDGVNVMMAAGSVRFIADRVSPSLWHVMHSRETPADLLPADLEAAASRDEVFPERRSQAIETTAPAAAPSHLLTNSLGMKLALIPAGEFVMGLPDKNNRWPYPDWDAPQHPVRITRPFWLAIYEVTQADFQTVMGFNPSYHKSPRQNERTPRLIDHPHLPVENVTWYDAELFCEHLSDLPAEKAAGHRYRLPTEAEWEFACRAGSKEPHGFDPDWPADGHWPEEIGGKDAHPKDGALWTLPVGSYAANAFGLHDMRGNVFEWTADWFDANYYSRSPVDDPQGPESGYLKIVRGWDWVFIGSQCKAFHIVTPPWKTSRFIGFRIVCEVTTKTDRL